jgi:penicillin G amidase
MTSKSSVPARLVAGLATASAAAAAIGLAGRYLLRRPLPQDAGAIKLAGIYEPVEIIRDPWGVPHIYARNEADLFLAQGYVHAQDRLFQMDTGRRVGAGRLAEIVGPAGLASDRAARIFGWHRAAEAQVAGILDDDRTATAARAYAAGVNAFMAAGRLPLEFSLLAYRPEPWQPYDSAAWGAVLAWGLSANWESELLRARLVELLGAERAADFLPNFPAGYPTIVPGATVGARIAEGLARAYEEMLQNLPLGAIPATPGAGSNNWVVAGEHTATGRPILANDPHLPPLFPTIWYENHLVGGDYQVTGFTSPGVPGVIIGHNDHIAWGITNAFPDIQDLYVERLHEEDPLLYEFEGQWRRAEERSEQIYVRGWRKPHTERVRYTHHGPIISNLAPGASQQLSLRWAAHDANNHLRALLGICRAHDWPSFRQAATDWAFPSQNVVYADVAGNIGYLMPGRVPQRARGHGVLPAPGWTGDYEWTGYIPAEELPHSFNPEAGMVVTANNHVVADDYPYFLCGEWLPPYRAQRILELLQEHRPLDRADMERIQQDTVSLPMRRFVRLALPHLAEEQPDMLRGAVTLLANWDGNMHVESSAASIAFAWFAAFLEACLTQALGPEVTAALLARYDLDNMAPSPFHELSHEVALCWLEGGAPTWAGAITSLLQPALETALAALARHYGPRPEAWRWGRMHVVHIHSHLARIPLLGRLWRPVTLPLGGDGYTVNQADTTPRFPPEPVHVIASCRMIVDVGAWDESVSALPGGQSGHPASDHYQDSIDDWSEGRYHPMLFSRDAVDRAAKSHLLLQPRPETSQDKE